MLFQFQTIGDSDREATCERFELFLKNMHQASLPIGKSISLEMGVIDGQITQAIRSSDPGIFRIAKQSLRNSFDSVTTQNLPDEAFVSQDAVLRHFAPVELSNDYYSIRRWRELLSEADPLTNILSSLAVNDHAKFRGHISLELTPLPSNETAAIRRCFEKLQTKFFQSHKRMARIYELLMRSERSLNKWAGSMVGLLSRSQSGEQDLSQSVAASRHHERETDLQTASNKLNSLCFSAKLNISVEGEVNRPDIATSLIHQLFAPFAQFAAPRLGQFKLGTICSKPPKCKPFLLSCDEVASIIHPPIHKTERMASSRFVSLEPPSQLPLKRTGSDLMELGKTAFHNQNDIFGLKDADAGLHGFLVGSSGSGKTTLLQTAILSLVRRGQGITLVDYHGDFARTISDCIPSREGHRVIEFDATAISPIAFNPLFCPDRDSWPLITDAVMTGIKLLFDSWGPRLEQILTNALSAAIIAGDTTLLDVRKMLYHEPTRVNILSRVNDELIREFWFSTFDGWDKKYRLEAIQSVINKLDALLTPKLRAVLCQTGPSFDFRRAFDQRKIVIVNLARGQLGQTAAGTLGSFVLSAIQQAALSRANVTESERKNHTVFLDELQLYSNSQAITSLLAEARKYRVSVWSATQSLASADADDVLPIVMANAANFVSFRVSHSDAIAIAPLLDNAVRPEDLTSLPRFHAYARLMVNGEVQRPLSMTTMPPPKKHAKKKTKSKNGM